MDTHELTYKTERDSQRIILWLLGERVEGKGQLGSLGWTYTLLYLKWITNKDLLQSTWNSAQCYMAIWTGGEFEGEWTYVYVWLSSWTIQLKLSQHCQLAISQYKIKKFKKKCYTIFIQIILLLSPKDNAQQLQQKFYKNKSSSSNFLSFGSLKRVNIKIQEQMMNMQFQKGSKPLSNTSKMTEWEFSAQVFSQKHQFT